MLIVYKTYRYSGWATVFSALMSVIAVCCLFGAIYFISAINESLINVFIAIIFLGLAAFFFFYLSRTYADKIDEKSLKKKLRTKPKFAYRFCKENPGTYEAVAAENPEFAEQYHLDENNQVVKI